MKEESNIVESPFMLNQFDHLVAGGGEAMTNG